MIKAGMVQLKVSLLCALSYLTTGYTIIQMLLILFEGSGIAVRCETFHDENELVGKKNPSRTTSQHVASCRCNAMLKWNEWQPGAWSLKTGLGGTATIDQHHKQTDLSPLTGSMDLRLTLSRATSSVISRKKTLQEEKRTLSLLWTFLKSDSFSLQSGKKDLLL